MILGTILLEAAATPAAGGASQYSGIIMIVLLFAIMYFFMIRPQQKQRKEIEKQRAALATGDKVVTAGGVHGKLKEIKDATYVVEVAEGVKITIDKTSVFAAPNGVQASK
ncbi:MAG: preprotein translocase subunit YajC [Candidatus Symbiothrix sp.]|jgi:preprotein translocase subunit YajC|nr:preprotein translocase subunit YajC [Candidatus Symbiothrix sp.]